MDNFYPEAQDIAMDVIEDNLEIDLEVRMLIKQFICDPHHDIRYKN